MEYQLFSSVFPVPIANQQRSYQYLQLPNGILTLVITDPSEDIASCCLTVAAGHHSDPDEIPGLAHLCEHMLCVSSKEHPSPDKYRTMVQQAGGLLNAVTNSERTCYYFSLPITASDQGNTFENILDIFSSNFREPLFNTEDSAREIYAIDNEHSNNKNARNRVSFYGYKLLANPENAFSRFSTGNFESLTESTKKYNIQSKLQAFFKKNYTSEKMTLVIRGPQSLNYLKKAAVTYFSSIGATYERGIFGTKVVNKHIKLNKALSDFNINEDSWKGKYKTNVYTPNNTSRGVLIQMDDIRNGTARLGFPISLNDSGLNQKDLCFLMDFFCEILGDESSGSLALELKNKEYIQAIITNSSNVTFDTAILEITLNLLPKGLTNFNEVLHCIFQYISLFINTTPKMIKHIGKSMSQFHGICIYNFLYSEPDMDSATENQHLSSLMLSKLKSIGKWMNIGFTVFDESTPEFGGSYNESKEFWLKKANMFSEFMRKSITVSNLLLTFAGDINKFKLNSSFIEVPKKPLHDKYFDVNYYIVKFDKLISKLNPDQMHSMGLPRPNQFAPDIINHQLDLLNQINKTAVASSDASLGYSIKNTGIMGKPKLIYHDEGSELWIKQETDVIFNDKGLLTIMLTPTEIQPTIELINAIEIMISLLTIKLNTFLYPAMLLNYSYSLLPSTKIDGGIIIHVSGPKSNIHTVLSIIVYELVSLSNNFAQQVSVDDFERHKRISYNSLENIYAMPSCVLSNFGLYATLEQYVWPIDERIESLNFTSKENVDKLVKGLFKSCYMTSFLQGDIDAKEYQSVILPKMNGLVKKFEGQNSIPTTTVLLPDNSNYKIHSFTKDASNVVTYFIQTNLRDDLKNRSLAKFVSYIMTTTLISKLRGEYQLGYIVQVGFKSTRKTQGICITIVNSLYDSKTLDQKIDMVLIEWFNQYFAMLKPNEFNMLIEKFIASEKSSNNLLTSMSGSPSLSIELFTIAGGERPIVAQHKSFWEQISTNVYAFSNNTTGEEMVDLELIREFTFDKVKSYVNSKILPNGLKRAKISVLLDSSRSKEELKTNAEAYRLFTWLGSMGLPIKYEDFVVIAQQSGDSKVLFGKNLFKYYRSKGKSISLVTGVLAKMSKSMISFSSNDIEINQKLAEEIDFNKIEDWRRKIGYVQEKEVLAVKLERLQI